MDNRKYGKGVYISKDGTKYEGDWKNDMRDGFGKSTFFNSDTYEGEWYFNKKHGIGEYRWADGRIYKGEWKYNN